QVRLFYAHVLRLRLGVGLLNGLIFPLDFWYIRNQGLSDDWPITHSVFSELVQFIIPFYEEALAVVIERLRNATPNFENQELVNFVRTLDGKTGFVGVIDPRAEDEAFHRKMEETLAERNCLRTHTTIQHGKE